MITYNDFITTKLMEKAGLNPGIVRGAEQVYRKMKARIVVTNPEFRRYADSMDTLGKWLADFFALFEGPARRAP